MICCSFVVGQFNGELVDGMRVDIGIDFIGAPNKYLLQAIDTKQNKFSIKTSETFSKFQRKFLIDFNGLTRVVSRGYFRRYYDGIFYLSTEFVFKQNNLYQSSYRSKYRPKYRPKYRFNDKLLLSNIQIVSNGNANRINNKQITSSLDWPDARDLKKMNNQTKIWLGYSNKIINNSDWSNNNNNQFIIGCIDWLKVNNKEIKLEMKGDNFYNYCKRKHLIESICNQFGDCRNKIISRIIYNYSILYCNKLDQSLFSLEMNTAKHCQRRELSNKNIELFHSHEITREHTKSIISILARLKQQAINQGLVEITTRNDSLIGIYLNSFKQIMLAIKHDKSINWSKYILYEISSNQIHVLRIELTESNSTFKVSNGYFIKTLILTQLGSVKLVNDGQNFGNKICKQLTTKFDFDYDSKQFRPRNESNMAPEVLTQSTPVYKSRTQTHDFFAQVRDWIIFLIMIASVSCLILICFVWIIGKIKKQKENIRRSTLNIYEEPIELNNYALSPCADVIEERNEYIYDE